MISIEYLTTVEAKMTRASSSLARPASPKSKCCAIGSQPLRMHEGGVMKRQHSSSPSKNIKTLAKCTTKAECFAQLKNLLPNARHEESPTELALVEETIAYIAYLEGILNSSNEQDAALVSTVDLLKSMAV